MMHQEEFTERNYLNDKGLSGDYDSPLEWSENLDGFRVSVSSTTEKDSPLKIINEMIDMPSLLMLIGASTAILSFAINHTAALLGSNLRNSFIGAPDDIFKHMSFVSWCILSAFISCCVTEYFCPEAVGGGLPEMKTILSGTIKPVLLSGNMILAKSLGLFFALVAGLPIGKEGPFVLIAAAIADQLMRFKFFA
jgi:H+/Cl- antiporter ClcA